LGLNYVNYHSDKYWVASWVIFPSIGDKSRRLYPTYRRWNRIWAWYTRCL